MNKQHIIQEIIALHQQFDQVMIQHRFQYWMDVDLTKMQFKCLLYIVQTGNATSKKLSDILGVTPANVTGVVDRLIIKGLVQREENANDRRFFLLQATENGKKMIEKLSRNASETISCMLNGLSEEELEHFYLGLSGITRTMNER